MDQLTAIAIYAIPVIIAITLHEAAHGFVARYFGDDTAAKAGRVTLNPLKHIDPFGTIILPAFLRSEERRVGKECRSRWSPYH